MLSLIKITSSILKLHILLYDQLTYSNSKEHMLNSTQRTATISIENTYYCEPSSIVIQSLGIYDHFRISHIGQNFLLILAQIQYPLKIESPCGIVAWWIMTINSLTSKFTIFYRECITYASALTMKNSSRWLKQVIPSIRM